MSVRTRKTIRVVFGAILAATAAMTLAGCPAQHYYSPRIESMQAPADV